MSQDIIADMITAVKNANTKKEKIVEVKATHTTRSIAKILLQEKFINNLRERHHKNQIVLVIALKYQGRQSLPSMTSFKQISKPGLRVYTNSQEIPRVLGGIGMVILSTSEGIMTDRQARQQKVGGEVLCSIW